MRFVATVFLWLVTTVALAAAVPAMWAQKNIVDANGYAAFTQSAAKDPRLQQAMASDSLDIALGSGPAMAFIAKGARPKVAILRELDQLQRVGARRRIAHVEAEAHDLRC